MLLLSLHVFNEVKCLITTTSYFLNPGVSTTWCGTRTLLVCTLPTVIDSPSTGFRFALTAIDLYFDMGVVCSCVCVWGGRLLVTWPAWSWRLHVVCVSTLPWRWKPVSPACYEGWHPGSPALVLHRLPPCLLKTETRRQGTGYSSLLGAGRQLVLALRHGLFLDSRAPHVHEQSGRLVCSMHSALFVLGKENMEVWLQGGFCWSRVLCLRGTESFSLFFFGHDMVG